jgi:3-deoxy-D-manno-octulosonic acid kinase
MDDRNGMEQRDPPSTRRLIQWGGRGILYNPSRLSAVSLEWFDPRFWELRSLVRQRFDGRGQALAVETPAGPAVLRCFLRGGWVARWVSDRYLYLGQERSRAFREFDLLQALRERGRPVPEALAALCDRSGPSYRAALIMREIPGAQTLAELAEQLTPDQWADLRATLESFFVIGLSHPDLNARNILRDQDGHWFLIDFDRARLSGRPVDPRPMIRRLRRSFGRLGLQVAPAALGDL